MRMRPSARARWLPSLVAVAVALAAGGRGRADVCVVIKPVLDIGCREGQGAPAGGEPTANSEPAGAPREPEPATRSSTVVRYDPRRVAVTFKAGITRARIAAVMSDAGGTLEQAIPKIHAYLVGVEPEQRAQALAPLQSSAAVATSANEPTPDAVATSPDDMH